MSGVGLTVAKTSDVQRIGEGTTVEMLENQGTQNDGCLCMLML